MENPWKAHSNLNPQREDGNRQIENGVFRAIMKSGLTASEYKIFMAVVEKTWGFNKSEDAISRTQFEIMTGLTGRMVKLAIDRMVRRRIIIRCSSAIRGKSGSPINLYMLNKCHDTWVEQGGNAFHGGNSMSPKGETQCLQRGNHSSHTKETITKETITKDPSASEKPKRQRRQTNPLVDAAYLTELKANPAFQNKDVEWEFNKAKAWISAHPGRKLSRKFFVNWLNNAKPDADLYNLDGEMVTLEEANRRQAIFRAEEAEYDRKAREKDPVKWQKEHDECKERLRIKAEQEAKGEHQG